jgi:hypothetical protein
MLHLMPTPNPRISITLTPYISSLLEQMSGLSGQSKSAIVADILEQSAPVFERLILLLQAAKDIQGQADITRAEAMAAIDAGEKRLHDGLGVGLSLMDDALGTFAGVAEGVRRRRAKGGRERSTPISNRGVKTSGKTLRFIRKEEKKGGQS